MARLAHCPIVTFVHKKQHRCTSYCCSNLLGIFTNRSKCEGKWLESLCSHNCCNWPDKRSDCGYQHEHESKVHGANMGPIWGRQDPGGPHIGHMNLAMLGPTHQSSRCLSPSIRKSEAHKRSRLTIGEMDACEKSKSLICSWYIRT